MERKKWLGDGATSASSAVARFGGRIAGVEDYQFTPAAERALIAAARWTCNGDVSALGVPELLLGLLAEAESRAAEMLAARGVSEHAVRQRWSELRPREAAEMAGEGPAGGRLSPDVKECLLAASARLTDFSRPLIFATEHLLLGVVAGRHEISAWLAEQGFEAEAVTAEIYRRHGYEVGADGAPAPLIDSSTAAKSPALEAPVVAERRRELDAQPPAMIGTARPTMAVSVGTGAWRVLDAAANRAREALRVVEDFARFVRDDPSLTGRLKLLRHRLTSALARLPAGSLLAGRNTPGDVGTSLTCAGERTRPDLASVVTANCKRLQESLRSLEEYGKLVDISFAAEIEQIRYESYTLEGALAVEDAGPRSLLAAARLYVLIDGRASDADFTELAAGLIASGVDVLQLRDKRLADRELLARARRLRELTRGTRTLFILNDRPDLAALSAAGQDEVGVAAARAIAGQPAIVGVSTHSLAQAHRAAAEGADYIGVGPTFPSRTKAFDSTQLQGVELLRAVAGEIQLPAFAIGGIEAANVAEALAAGITRIAVSGAVLTAADPLAAARELRGLLPRSDSAH